MHIAVLAGDGIGREIMVEGLRVLNTLGIDNLKLDHADVGGVAYKNHGHPLPAGTLDLAKSADAILFGAVGDPDCDNLDPHLRPEQAVLGLRKELDLFANLRPAKAFTGLENLSALKPEVAGEIDLLIIRELTGDIYFGEKGRRKTKDGLREGYDIMSYNEAEITRIAHIAFKAAQGRRKKLCSVDKANVLQTSVLWREIVSEVAGEYPDVTLSHMYVDNAAMQMVRNPGQFDVVLTGNIFGDILSDQASMCVGSIGLLASASLGGGTRGLYEPIHGSAPDIAGQGIANPMAMILSIAMMLRHSFDMEGKAVRVERTVADVLENGVLGHDLGGNASTSEIGDAVVARLSSG